MLHSQKAHEKHKFSKVQKVFGWIRFEEDPSYFYRFQVERDNLSIEESSRTQINIKSFEVDTEAKRAFENHPRLEGEESLQKFLKNLPERRSWSEPEFENQERRNYFKSFIIGSNSRVDVSAPKFDYLSRLTQPLPLAQTLANQTTWETAPSQLKQSLSKSVSTRSINPLLLSQYLLAPLDLPAFLARSEITEEKERELQVEYQNWGLEEGEFFDGFLFRDQFGEPFEEHPSKWPRPK